MSKLAGVPPRRKINVTSKSPVGDISVVTLIRTDTTLDHSQKAEKVWSKGHVDCKGTPPRETKVRVRVALGRYNTSWGPHADTENLRKRTVRRTIGNSDMLGPSGPAKIEEVTLMRPFHGNL